ncbi:Sjoegren syndrome nuclear autoantigen 1 isoform X1 [Coturnix japonica]|uniref:Sjoegren syndrome nuclear autoantigen 1 isoform X1 n=1 Tax=Coturnix japonica TaxID=93934 RepID=UPI0013A5E998|nr:Sjoegren syndrome nuclear autoantigen 1 isoform X1 [Coturnix japonica]
MSGTGETLQGYNAALLEGLAELRARRDELSERIREEEAERERLQSRIAALTERLARSSERTARNLAAKRQLENSIAESEAAYGKGREMAQGFCDSEYGHNQRNSCPAIPAVRQDTSTPSAVLLRGWRIPPAAGFWRVLRHC